jgi:molybdopterin molybdotransferase
VAELLTIEEAQALILEAVRPLPAEDVPLSAAFRRVLAADARATVDLPPFRSSAMDGFAIRAADAAAPLRVVDRAAAGRPSARTVAAGEAIAVATGGVVPDGADAVVPIEHVDERDGRIELRAAVDNGDNVRPVGGDVRRGEVVVSAGTRLAPAQLGALAAAGVATVVCARRLRAAVLATGTELRAPGEPLEHGQIYESNTTLLAAALEDAGAVATLFGPVADDDRAHREALAAALEHDIVVSSGGVSVGPHDLVRRVAAELGVREVFWRVAVKPGKPVAFGVRDATLVFGLPGNPVSSLVGFELFVRPAVLALQGVRNPLPRFHVASLAAPLRRNPERDELVRGRASVDGEQVTVAPVRGQESHMIVRAAGADALVLVPRGDGELPAGSAARYLSLG